MVAEPVRELAVDLDAEPEATLDRECLAAYERERRPQQILVVARHPFRGVLRGGAESAALASVPERVASHVGRPFRRLRGSRPCHRERFAPRDHEEQLALALGRAILRFDCRTLITNFPVRPTRSASTNQARR